VGSLWASFAGRGALGAVVDGYETGRQVVRWGGEMAIHRHLSLDACFVDHHLGEAELPPDLGNGNPAHHPAR
jgi:hypothetical protein